MLTSVSPMDDSETAAMLAVFEALSLAAGIEIMDVHAKGVTAETKTDASPVTEADRRAEEVILKGLAAHFPSIPVVAEEEAAAGRIPFTDGKDFFLVDPLDGTKEFIGGKTDFTVNIALVSKGVPIVGVVYAPARGVIWSGRPGAAIVASLDGNAIGKRRAISGSTLGETVRVVASKSHRTPETDDFIARFEGAETVSVGSSLKFCLLAEGAADIYPRFGRTMEWDTAAGDAVLRAAGGTTVKPDGAPFAYGKRNQADDSDFANSWFIAVTGQARALLG